MEQLLNIKEAARMLHVTETTIRRWTNQGILNCYRIGAKRERRFKMEDLTQYLKSGNDRTGQPSARLGYKDFDVQGGAHMTHLSLGADESLTVGAAYVSEGLRRGETVLIVAPVEKTKSLLHALHEQKINADIHLRSGMLFLSEGADNPVKQIESIQRHAGDACGGFRVFGDMTWTQNKGWSAADLRELEERAGEIPDHARHLLFCQYPLDRFSAHAAMMAIETHDVVLYRDKLVASPYA